MILKCLQPTKIKKNHIGHMNIEKSKKRARELSFWPDIYDQIADIGKMQYLHKLSELKWEMDICSYIHTRKTMESCWFSKLANTCNKTVILHTKSFFADHGIPEVVRSYSAPQYIAKY